VRQAAAAEEEEIAVGVNEMPVDGFDLLPGVTSDGCTLPWTLMSRLQLKSLMRSCARASRQLEMLIRMEMSSEATGEADDSRQQPSQVTLSNALLCLDTVRAYMEKAVYDSYERLYGLIIDQVQEIATAKNND